jgi:tetratricopeptide (TPR) repeat protein
VLFHQGKHAEAEKMARQLLEVQRRVIGAQHDGTVSTMSLLGRLLRDQAERGQGNYDEAEKLLREVAEIRQQKHGREHPFTSHALNHLALLFKMRGDFEEAEKLFKEAIEVFTHVMGDEHRYTLGTVLNLADLYIAQSKYEAAEPLLVNTVEKARHALGDDDPLTGQLGRSLSRTYYLRADEPALHGRWKEAAQLLAEGITLDSRPEHRLWLRLAALRIVADDAEQYKRQRVEMLDRFGDSEDVVVASEIARASLLLPANAETLRAAVELAERAIASGANDASFKSALLSGGIAAYRQGHFDIAIDRNQKSLKVDPNQFLYLKTTNHLFLAMSHARLGQDAESKQLLAKADAIMKQRFPPPDNRALPQPWPGWLMCQIFRREAEAVVNGNKKPTREPDAEAQKNDQR